MSTRRGFSQLFANPKFWVGIVLVVLFAVWSGIPAYNKWQADKRVDALCAKDSGIKVYETVKLPADKFSEFGEIYVPEKSYAKPTDEYYYTSETQWIIREGTQVRDLDLRRYHEKLFRVADGKLLAEGVGYARRGGDAAGPWHPSSHSCPVQSGTKSMNQQTFIRDEKSGEKK